MVIYRAKEARDRGCLCEEVGKRKRRFDGCCVGNSTKEDLLRDIAVARKLKTRRTRAYEPAFFDLDLPKRTITVCLLDNTECSV